MPNYITDILPRNTPNVKLPELPPVFNAVKTMEEVKVVAKQKALHQLQPSQKGSIKITSPQAVNDNTILYLSIAAAALIIYFSTSK